MSTGKHHRARATLSASDLVFVMQHLGVLIVCPSFQAARDVTRRSGSRRPCSGSDPDPDGTAIHTNRLPEGHIA